MATLDTPNKPDDKDKDPDPDDSTKTVKVQKRKLVKLEKQLKNARDHNKNLQKGIERLRSGAKPKPGKRAKEDEEEED